MRPCLSSLMRRPTASLPSGKDIAAGRRRPCRWRWRWHPGNFDHRPEGRDLHTGYYARRRHLDQRDRPSDLSAAIKRNSKGPKDADKRPPAGRAAGRTMQRRSTERKNIAVIGTGISGMSAAWLLSQDHKVTVYESERRIGGHSNTVTVEAAAGDIAVDTGFIVYNELTYPNLTALFSHLDVADAIVRYVVRGFARRRRSGIFRQPCGTVCRKAQSVPAAFLVDAARPAALLSRSAARSRSARANSIPRSAIISKPAPTARPSATIICCRWRPRSGPLRRGRSSIIRRRLSSASTIITGSSSCATVRPGAPCWAAAAPMSSA